MPLQHVLHIEPCGTDNQRSAIVEKTAERDEIGRCVVVFGVASGTVRINRRRIEDSVLRRSCRCCELWGWLHFEALLSLSGNLAASVQRSQMLAHDQGLHSVRGLQSCNGFPQLGTNDIIRFVGVTAS